MTSPFRIFIGGQELIGYTNANLRRSKKEMTGELNVTIFFTHMPRNMVHRNAVAGAVVTVYVGGHLAFTGTLDKRHGKGGKHGPTTSGKGKSGAVGKGQSTRGGALSTHIGPNDYTITMRARGKTKSLIDSSQDHETGMIPGAKTKPAIEKLVKNHKVELDWLAPVYDMDKIRFRDGATVKSEVHRIANENAYYTYETRDGKLRVTDGTGHTVGEPLILGENILQFSAEQSEEPTNSQVKVKGQRTIKSKRGRDAVNREKTVNIGKSGGNARYAPLNLQHYGDGTDEALDRRAKFEGDAQNAEAKQVRVDVFHVMSRTGLPWDVGNVHYVEIGTEGIYEPMECTEVNYVVNNDKTLETKLTLSPLPGATGSSGSGPAGLPTLNLGPITDQVSAYLAHGASRRNEMEAGYTDGLYPESWGPLQFSVLDVVAGAFDIPKTISDQVAALPVIGPLLKLPDGV